MSLSTRTSLQIYVAKHAKERRGDWVSGNLVFFRMHRISDIYFVGGFGTVQWVDVANYMATKPDSIVAADPQQTISVCHLHVCSVGLIKSYFLMVRPEHLQLLGEVTSAHALLVVLPTVLLQSGLLNLPCVHFTVHPVVGFETDTTVRVMVQRHVCFINSRKRLYWT